MAAVWILALGRASCGHRGLFPLIRKGPSSAKEASGSCQARGAAD